MVSNINKNTTNEDKLNGVKPMPIANINGTNADG